MKPKISVIVPVYNVENYLTRCLESIVNQTFNEIEIICINDGSTDSSKQILEEFQRQDNRILIIDKNNSGYGASCNMGLRLAQGEHICIIEPDDFIDNKMFEDLYNLSSKHNADVVKSSFYEYKDAQNGEEEKISKIDWNEQYKMPDKVFRIKDCPQFMYFHPSIWTCLYRKSFLDKNNIRFVEAKGAGWTDNPFQVKTLCLAKRIFYTNQAYYYYRLTNPTSSSNVLNVSNPFDRSDEIHRFLKEKNIRDKNLLAYLYKRELGYVEKVLGSINDELFDFACTKVSSMILRMERKILEKNKFINASEKMLYQKCKTYEGLEKIKNESSQNEKIVITNS